ncbi:glutathione S-transferase family protein [Candidatus Cyanaurora vandensis]|uniref:glutathione S-transferase family protein n=1 Tax=Candidatus Cyanaurora vandensis TaxID=2714958 RepID=UPI00257F44CF|nr:glutathione S-transferase family protein [Candidatus Cyanaurora vandensis]
MPLGMLVDGQWVNEERDRDAQGRFNRTQTQYRQRVGSADFPVVAGRYHLYVSLACPWAHRTLIMRALQGLEDIVGVSTVEPVIHDNGWEFSPDYPDTAQGKRYLWELYTQAKPDYSGKVTVPVLWDKQTQTIINNESREILRMFDTEFGSAAKQTGAFYPPDLQAQIDNTIDAIYEPINNGVYRSGFAATQTAYTDAVKELFEALDHWETVLSRQRYLVGATITEADWCLFTTLLRFDPVYHGHFKCNLCRLMDYPNLWNYLKDLYQQPGVRATCDLDQIKRHYYQSHTHINPTGIVPLGPLLDLDSPHNRQ